MQRKKDPYAKIRQQVLRALSSKVGRGKEYETLEKFCWQSDIAKSTVSRFLNDKNSQYSVKFLLQLAKALGKELEIKLK